MSGLLRRIKRSRAADAGEAPAEGQAAGPEGAPTTAATAAGVDARGSGDPSSAETTELPAVAPAGEDAAHAPDQAGAVAPSRSRFARLRRRRATIEPPPAAPATQGTAQILRADPSTPAGLDPAAAVVGPPSGRRGRLRRRLRYLRRARELMLRDLGGLLYEVHRTAGGDVTAHSTVIGAKVERLSRLDAESEAIETALGAPRSEAVVFQPGVGGTCDNCGELYGSAARFCSNCGSPTDPVLRTTVAPAGEARTVPAMPQAPEPARPPRDEPGEAAGTPGSEDETGSVTTGEQGPESPAGETTATAPGEQPQAPDPATEPQNPSPGLSNGRADDRNAPGLSSGDPLAREGRS